MISNTGRRLVAGGGGPDKDGVRAIYERSPREGDAHIRVADLGGEVVGLLALSVRSSLYHHLPYIFIDEFVVKAGHRGVGIGKRLMDEAFALAARRGCGGVCLDTSATNEGALRFYRARGFDRESIMLEKEFI